MDEFKAKDPLTGQEFIKHRHNQKFATRRNQIRYNNIKALRKRQQKKKLDLPLDRNRNILMKLLGNKSEVTKSRDWLLALDYRFDLYNRSIKLDDEIVPCVYEFILINLKDNTYKIKKDAEY